MSLIKFDEKLCIELIDDVPLNKFIKNHNTTFLNTAFIYENFKMFKMLLEKGADKAIKDNEGKWFIDELTPIFTEDRDYINRLVYPESDD